VKTWSIGYGDLKCHKETSRAMSGEPTDRSWRHGIWDLETWRMGYEDMEFHKVAFRAMSGEPTDRRWRHGVWDVETWRMGSRDMEFRKVASRHALSHPHTMRMESEAHMKYRKTSEAHMKYRKTSRIAGAPWHMFVAHSQRLLGGRDKRLSIVATQQHS